MPKFDDAGMLLERNKESFFLFDFGGRDYVFRNADGVKVHMLWSAKDRDTKIRLFQSCFGGVQFACWVNTKEEEHYAHLWAEEWKPRLEELIYDV